MVAAVTIATLAATTWICGAFVLPMHDGSVRWNIATGVGGTVAALALAWGAFYANAKDDQPACTSGKAQQAGADQSPAGLSITGGTFYGPVMHGKEIRVNLKGHGAGSPPPVTPEAADRPPTQA